MSTVPFFDYKKLYLNDKERINRILDDVGSRGAYILQSDLMDFEKKLAEYAGCRYSIGVGNATDGLEFGWMSLKIKPGDEVICSAHTMLATASAIVTAGGRPVPIDIGWDGLMDVEAIEGAINSKTVGIMPTQLNGRICNMTRIMEIATNHKLFVVEDAAQALGAKYKGKHAGTFGSSGAISFFPAKVLGCLGDGGAVLTNDDELYDRIFQLHDHGRNISGEVMSWGRNSRLDNLQAAILLSKLNDYEAVIKRRREIASIYQTLLGENQNLHLPPPPQESGDNFDIYQNYEIRAKDRDGLKKYLLDKGIGTLVQWGGKAIHQWDHLGFDYQLPKVESFFNECIMLPMNVFVSNSDVEYVASQINNFYKINTL